MILADILSQQRSPFDNSGISFSISQEGKGESSKLPKNKVEEKKIIYQQIHGFRRTTPPTRELIQSIKVFLTAIVFHAIISVIRL